MTFSVFGQSWGASAKMELVIEKGLPLCYLQLGFQICTWHTKMFGPQPVELEAPSIHLCQCHLQLSSLPTAHLIISSKTLLHVYI